MVELVITGGQTGADQAGWRAAKAAGIATGGAMPIRFLTEEGPRPDFAELYGAHALDSADYAVRTGKNVIASGGTLWFCDTSSLGGRRTVTDCRVFRKPFLEVPLEGATVYSADVVEWISAQNIKVLNIAGNRESTQPGIGARVEAFLARVFTLTL